jgi:hypothetical protein
MKRRKFADGGETTEMMPSAKPEGGRFDEDTYSRARRFVESGGKKEETKSAVKKARKVEIDPTAGEAKDKASQRAADMMDSAPTPAPKATERASDTSTRFPMGAKSAPKDDTSKSLSERIKESRERARTSSTGTDTRSVSERIRGALGFSKGGKTKKYAEGGMVGSASRRADGIATKGKTKCRIV